MSADDSHTNVSPERKEIQEAAYKSKILKRVQNDKVVEILRLFCENGLQRQLLLTQTQNARIIKVA
ncbi:hypothetical protein J6O48_06805 [bacterium]|nr:hypothetical protein [bacterium]